MSCLSFSITQETRPDKHNAGGQDRLCGEVFVKIVWKAGGRGRKYGKKVLDEGASMVYDGMVRCLGARCDDAGDCGAIR